MTSEEHAHWLSLPQTRFLLKRLQAEQQAELAALIATGEEPAESFLRARVRRAHYIADTIKTITKYADITKHY